MKEPTKSLTILMSELIRCQKDVDERYEELEDRLEKATLDTISSGYMTKDLVGLFHLDGVTVCPQTSRSFLEKIAERL